MVTHLPTVLALEWDGYYADDDDLVSLRLLGRYPVRVQSFWVPAVVAMEHQLERTGYENPCDYIGSWMVRNIAGSVYASWHSYGAAVDLDYGGDNPDSPDHPLIDRNPHIHRKIYPADPGFGVEWQILEHQVHAIEAIRTMNGKRVWRWLGWSIGDTMHWEPACTPDDIETGIDPTSLIGGADMNCPWINTTTPGGAWFTDYPPCTDHYTVSGEYPVWGVDTGVCNVPSWGENGINYGIDTGRLDPKDNNRDDFTTVLTYGRWLTMEDRANN